MPTPDLQTTTYTAVGDREDLTDMIYIISPTDTPIVSSITEKRASYRFHEWQTYSYAAQTTAGAIEGNTIAFASGAARTRTGNYISILTASVSVSDIQRLVNVAGVDDEWAWEMEQSLKRIANKLEVCVVQSASASGSTAAAIAMNGLQAAVTTTVLTAGSVRDYTRALHLSAMKAVTDQGGNADLIIAKNAVAIDLADWPATIGGGTASAAAAHVDIQPGGGAIYDGTWRTIHDPWGTRTIKYDRVGVPTATASAGVYLLASEQLAIAVLDRLHVVEAAKVGLSKDGWLQMASTLEFGNEAAHAQARQISNT